jgi:putative membrane protein
MDNKFRNHPSLMLEQLGVFGVIIITFLISSLDDLDEILGDIKNSDSTTLLIIILVILAVILFRLAVNTIVWYKTWITVDETSITITKNTIFRSVNTIGLRNISNINIERNLLERILGTSTVKIDTESRSTADTTDVAILLRKDKAEALRERLLAGATAAKHTQTIAANEQLDGTAGAAASVPNSEQTSNPTSVPNDGQISDPTSVPNNGQVTSANAAPNSRQVLSEVAYNTKQVLTHCVYSASIISLLVCLAALIAIIAFFLKMVVFGDHSIGSLIQMIPTALGGIVVIGSFVYAALRSLIGDFFRYYSFRIKRMPDHLHMEFGLFKRTSYEIPIKRISSIIVQRPVFSRISKRCFVDIINIGMGDEKEENTRLLLSIPEKHLPELLHRLLPEFDAYFTESDTAPIRPPKAIWWKKIIGSAKLLVFLAIGWTLMITVFGVTGLPAVLGCIGSFVLAMLIYLIGCYGTYKANKLQLRENYIAITNGMFASSTQFIDYHKIQYMELQQTPVERLLHLQHGIVYILAGAMNSFAGIPCFAKEQIDPIVQLFLEDSCNRRKKSQ